VVEWRDPCELEAMVRAAGGYVRASDDLRPRILETARAQQGEQRARRWIRRIAVCVALAAVFAASGDHLLAVAGIGRELALNPSNSQAMHSQAEKYTASGGDIGWGLVKAFTELRHRQSAAFRL
jgi:hypothetical protein